MSRYEFPKFAPSDKKPTAKAHRRKDLRIHLSGEVLEKAKKAAQKKGQTVGDFVSELVETAVSDPLFPAN